MKIQLNLKGKNKENSIPPKKNNTPKKEDSVLRCPLFVSFKKLLNSFFEFFTC